ncbi:hypothetical protein BP6252_05233 [Coleophoma cylindrospora]|uniref:SPRY domain-containing protein n=1 Tax=Coleophoma cylindrospora TaxID=1849047 RepID=A0A3D8RTA1_9HELO|nr:hypothetical protein BP6252_05233 [Coleophoma cylindrospora]
MPMTPEQSWLKLREDLDNFNKQPHTSAEYDTFLTRKVANHNDRCRKNSQWLAIQGEAERLGRRVQSKPLELVSQAFKDANPLPRPTNIVGSPSSSSTPDKMSEATSTSRKRKVSEKKRESELSEKKHEGERAASNDTPAPAVEDDPSPVALLYEPQPSAFNAPTNPVATLTNVTNQLPEHEFFALETGNARNSTRRGLRFEHSIADPTFKHFQNRTTEIEPYGPHWNYMDVAVDEIYLNVDHNVATTSSGYRSIKGNIWVREGRYYLEYKIARGMRQDEEKGSGYIPRVRMGFGRREANLNTNVGADCYGYGLRDVNGEAIWKASPLNTEGVYKAEPLHEGDVIGMEINLPSLELHMKIVNGTYNPAVDFSVISSTPCATNIVRDRAGYAAKSNHFLETIEPVPSKVLHSWVRNPAKTRTGDFAIDPNPTHPLPEMRTLPGSYIKVYKNGVLLGNAFKDLLAFLPPASQVNPPQRPLDDGRYGYYPMGSVFGGGALAINCGPNFEFPPPEFQDDNTKGKEPAHMTEDKSKGKEPAHMTEGESQLPDLKPIHDLYTDLIAEDIVADLVDETIAALQAL